MKPVRLVFALALIGLLSQPGYGASEIDGQQIDRLFEKLADGPGAAVGVYHKGEVVYTNGFGLADIEQGSRITPKTVFHVASISKQFTAFSIMLLAQDGRLELDDDIRKYLPYVPDFGSEITIRHLIFHTSGLRDQWSLFAFGGQNRNNRLSQSQIVNMVSRQRALNYEPGTEWSYSNTGYTLLAEIVEAVSGQTLRAFTNERIFAPLGMTDTFFYDDASEVVPRRANSYYYSEARESWRRDALNFENYGATSLHTTAEDLLKWADNVATAKVGGRALWEQMLSAGYLDDGTPLKYGYGLMRLMMMNTSGREVIGHLGRDSGFMGIFLYVPEAELGVVILGNGTEDPRPRAWKVVEAVIGSRTDPELVPPKTPRLRGASRDGLLGQFLAPYGRPMVFERRPDGSIAADGQSVVFRADGTFDLGDELRPRRYYRPVIDERGMVSEVINVDRMGHSLTYVRTPPVRPARAELDMYVGEYRSAELDVTYAVSVRDGNLTLSSLWFREPVVLSVVARDRFAGMKNSELDGMEAESMESIRFVRDGDGLVTALLVSDNGRVRDLVFERCGTGTKQTPDYAVGTETAAFR